jgi:hypothetical protein
MVDRHPITPPPGLVRKWLDLPLSEEEIVVTAYRAGADRELEACCEWLCTLESNAAVNTDRRLRAARRPKALGWRTPMADLSPAAQAAQAVLDAYDTSPFDDDLGDRVAIAAALRAAADQVVPEEPWHGGDQRLMYERDAHQSSRRKLLDIAAELDGATITSDND